MFLYWTLCPVAVNFEDHFKQLGSGEIRQNVQPNLWSKSLDTLITIGNISDGKKWMFVKFEKHAHSYFYAACMISRCFGGINQMLISLEIANPSYCMVIFIYGWAGTSLLSVKYSTCISLNSCTCSLFNLLSPF